VRVGLVAPGFSASEEDWCIPALLDLVRTLAGEDDVTVFSLRYPHTRERYRVYGAEVHPFGGAQRRGPARLPLLLRAVVRIFRENRKRRFDVLHALWAHEPGFVAALAGRLTRTPVLVSVLGGELVDIPEIDYGGQRSSINRWLIRQALRSAARVTVGSELLERIAGRHVASGKLVRWPLGVDRSRFFARASETPWGGEGGQGGEGISGEKRDGGPIVLHVASLSPVKDQATLLRAFAIVAERLPAARLHVVGDGESRRGLERLADEPGIAGRVEWHGAVGHERLADLYRRADLFVLSSLFESQAMVVLEAAACGCPAIGTAVGVLPELGGPTVRPGNVEGLGELMLSVLQDPGERAAIVAAQRDALPAFGLDRTAGDLRRAYRSLVVS
jgi:glycosyltransferase involved in cell wall biosynthesis